MSVVSQSRHKPPIRGGLGPSQAAREHNCTDSIYFRGARAGTPAEVGPSCLSRAPRNTPTVFRLDSLFLGRHVPRSLGLLSPRTDARSSFSRPRRRVLQSGWTSATAREFQLLCYHPSFLHVLLTHRGGAGELFRGPTNSGRDGSFHGHGDKSPLERVLNLLKPPHSPPQAGPGAAGPCGTRVCRQTLEECHGTHPAGDSPLKSAAQTQGRRASALPRANLPQLLSHLEPGGLGSSRPPTVPANKDADHLSRDFWAIRRTSFVNNSLLKLTS